jgi:hypothetical protein
MPDNDAPQGFRVNPRAGEDPIAMRDYVTQQLDLDPWQPQAKGNRDGGESDEPVHPTWGKPDALYWYRSADGEPAFAVARWEAKGKRKKQIRPVVKRDGRWLWEAMKGKRPLYGLRRLLEHADRQVVVVEGERKADALQAVLHQNLAALASASSFEEAVHSLTAAAHLLTARVGGGSTLRISQGKAA